MPPERRSPLRRAADLARRERQALARTTPPVVRAGHSRAVLAARAALRR
ncbi:MAG: hypothetical protein ACXVFK_09095 [Solirubrobacteraceae bacterium]